MVAVPVMCVFVVLSVLPTTVPPTAVTATAVGAVGRVLSTSKVTVSVSILPALSVTVMVKLWVVESRDPWITALDVTPSASAA